MSDNFIISELRRIRIEKRVSQIDAARGSGVTISTFKHWEDGTIDPGFRKVCRWAEYLGYELDIHYIGRKLRAAE